MNNTSHFLTTFKHTLIYSSSNVATKVAGFIMLPIYAHHLHGQGYGIIGMIDVFLSILAVFIGFGIQGGITRIYFEKVREGKGNLVISTGITLVFIAACILCIPLLFADKTISYLLLGDEKYFYYIYLATITFIFEITSKASESYILIQKRSKLYISISIIKFFIAISLNIYLIVFLEMGVLGYLYSSLITTILYAFFTIAYYRYHFNLIYDSGIAKNLIDFNLPLIPGYIALFIRNNTGRVILRIYYGLSEVGRFEMMYKFVYLIGLFIYEPFSKIWNVKKFEIAELDDGDIILSRMFTLIFTALIYFGLILSLEIPVLLKIITPEEFWVNSYLCSIATISYILHFSQYHFNFGILYSKKTYLISLINIYTTILNVVLSFILIKYYGIYGMVFTSLLTNLVQCILSYRFSIKYYLIKYEWKKISSITLFAILLFIIISSMPFSEMAFIKNVADGIFIYISKIINLDVYAGKYINIIHEKFVFIFEMFLILIFCQVYLFILFINKDLSIEKILSFRNKYLKNY